MFCKCFILHVTTVLQFDDFYIELYVFSYKRSIFKIMEESHVDIATVINF